MAKKSFDAVKKLYETAIQSTTYRTFMTRSQVCFDFRDGIQWSLEEQSELLERGQVPVVINKITNRIKGLSGTEIVGRTRIAYAPRSFDPTNEATAEALTHLALFVQDRNNAVFHRSKTFEDALVCGIGAYITEKDEEFPVSRRIDPRNVFWDTADTSFDLSESSYRGFRNWFSAEDLVETYPKKENDLKRLVGMSERNEFADSITVSLNQSTQQDYIDESGRINYVDKTRGRILVVEVEYRQKEPAYEYVDSEGRLIRTFDADEAKKNRITAEEARKRGFFGLTYRELSAYRYYTCQFAGDVELYHAPSEINLKPDFDLQLMVLDKTETDNVPVGLVYWAIDSQRELNKRRSKMLHHLNTARIVADSDAFENPELVRREAARPDAMITKKKGSEVKIEYTLDLAKGQFDVMNLSDKEIQDQLGIHDDMLGMETNATSGVAIQRRQNNSMRMQAPSFDKFKLFLKKHGELLLAYIQNTFRDEQVVTIVDDGGLAKAVQINAPLRDKDGQVVTRDGKPIMVHDIRAGAFDVYVKETLDAAAISEDVKERLSQMLMNGVQPSALTLMAAGLTERQAAEMMKKAAPPQQVLPSPADAAAGQAPTPQGVPQ